jgi:hypothetical protein
LKTLKVIDARRNATYCSGALPGTHSTARHPPLSFVGFKDQAIKTTTKANAISVHPRSIIGGT